MWNVHSQIDFIKCEMHTNIVNVKCYNKAKAFLKQNPYIIWDKKWLQLSVL